ncbi:hypothetical protein [Mucilaginibacter aquaedulcis]|uniref:hypothetical protein n=1 Tax=Mucilaginibacter aquaedulcis TaxID=1187081 RepID=UPI0025B2C71E|nr:hypothetical protein [Mucilaginibacter aquaedulcis]MDN3547147.1 hypothetical protein [Mucilaginibacter aquaedulcis]
MKLLCFIKTAGLIAVFILSRYYNGYAQQHADSASAVQQTAPGNDSTLLSFVHISYRPKWAKPQSFRLSFSNNEIQWQSNELKPITLDSLGFLVKVNVPIKLYHLNPMYSCTATINPTKKISYGGVNIHGIQLELRSNPQKAEVYLIPRRIWLNQIQNSNWQKNNALIETFLVDSDKTDTTVNIDETVYTVIFKLNDKFLVRTHYTKPQQVEPRQKVSVDF